MTLKTFNLPDVGEGLTEAEVVQWRVAPGAAVSVNDIICEIETAKSLVELSSPYAGTVAELLVPEGETIEVGTPIISVEDGADTGSTGDTADSGGTAETGNDGATDGAGDGSRTRAADRRTGSDDPVPVPEMPGEMAGPQAGDDTPDAATAPGSASAETTPGPLVGTGPKADAVKRRPRKGVPSPTPLSPARAAESDRPVPETLQSPADGNARVTAGSGRTATANRASRTMQPSTTQPAAAQSQAAPATQATPSSAGTGAPGRVNPLNQLIHRVLAKPPVRKAARDLGINLADVPATGSAGEVTKQDLMSYQAQREAEQDGADSFWEDRSLLGGGRIERIPVKGVRKATARAMVQSAFTAPHVSIFVDVDASRTMEFVKRLKASRDFEGIRVSPLLILAKAVIWAAARNPSVNATWSDEEILVKHFMNLGIAAATPRGLMVPNIKDAQDLSLKELALALNELATTARAGKTQPAQMQGGTLTITNIGALGIDTGTPIINPGEVAIVAFGTIKQKPWVLDGEVIPRWITTLGGSFDHRVVDGDLSARFMADVASILEEPALLLD
ncbi:2-oxo acid dehydrogenase subunit E2 [Arthrobacter agilis]|uniref:dihydrolipoamide acetyltransferase family protein n=1 Tax=Arthrobacter agilis TaxID=37921 RepID=UPI000B362BEA|nr:dihydrolipoamide acetyltransferase family protein [Arthrobacter agilis]OUM42162.1 branched-chain alpha-keto acid dehydrogenase subunit E2 [Arthrobacter agilis]PPB45507.1 branched-chain alpha-keto acid dehydrogenase subunit E2 [Arthrobacter agilis]TPV26517.1 2-oxo acid dehydrogenase subunit E2 [Arthrobacter agilis]VDR33571.1 Dihydrolipoyllysine-residue acetyltransferase component of pyruvate dehydrogenase complex [Arthrobacter agilis]